MATLVCVFPFLYNIGQVPKRTEDINISLYDHQFALEIMHRTYQMLLVQYGKAFTGNLKSVDSADTTSQDPT